MPPKLRKKENPFPIYDFSNFHKLLKVKVDEASVFRETETLELLEEGFHTATRLNDEAKHIIRNHLNKRVVATPKKRVQAVNDILSMVANFRKVSFDDDGMDDHSFLAPQKLNFDDIAEEPADESAAVSGAKLPSPVKNRTPLVTPKKSKKLAVPTHSPAVPKKPAALACSPAILKNSAATTDSPTVSKKTAEPRQPPSYPSSPSRLPKPGFASSKSGIPRPAVNVPRAALTRKPDPKAIEIKSRQDLELAEERRNEILQDKVLRSKIERTERENRIRQKRMEQEEERKRQNEAQLLKEAKAREFEARQRAELTLSRSAPHTPKSKKTREVGKEKQVKTPRHLHVPPKKGRDVVATESLTEVSSPSPVRKKAIPAALRLPSASVSSQDRTDSTSVPDSVTNADDIITYVEIEENGDEVFYSPSGTRHLCRPASFNDNSLSRFEKLEQEFASERVSETKFFMAAFPDRYVPKLENAEETSISFNNLTHVVTPKPMAQNRIQAWDALDEPSLANDENEPPKTPVVAVEEEKSSYDMTAEKIFLPSTEENYNIDDLSSNDETDDETKPRKTVPAWARKSALEKTVRKMLSEKTMEEMAAYYGPIAQPTIERIFPGVEIKSSRTRNSSGKWNSPLCNPTPGVSRLHKYK